MFASDNDFAPLKSLNDIQRQAVLHPGGPMVIFAGAGSGKTRVITTRIAYLISRGARPSSILAVTFTNKAAREMRERLVHLGGGGHLAHVATFHAACTRWLREFASEIGFTSDFTIYDDKDAQGAIKAIAKEMNIDIDEHSPADYRAAINRAKMYGWLPADVDARPHETAKLFPPLGARVYRRYQEYLAACNAMDFNDLLMNMLLLLRNNLDVRGVLQRRYHHILVDEYQDTNPTQFAIINLLLGTERNLCVVGDDDQSIYSWRGADPSNILNFKQHFPGAEEVRLEQNYRCTGNIVKAASAVVQVNKQRAAKILWTDNAAGEKIRHTTEYDGEMEAYKVVEQIQDEVRQFGYEDIAIFYRTNAQSRSLEDALRRSRVPYRIYGSLRFYDRQEIKDVLAYFRLLVNPHDDMAFRRCVNVPTRGFGKTALEQIEARAQKERISLWEMSGIMADEGIARLSGKLGSFRKMMDKIKVDLAAAPLNRALEVLITAIQYTKYLEKKFPQEATDKIGNVQELGAAMSDYETEVPEANLTDWLRDTALSGSEKESDGGVCLMTLHSAKGLEFPRVYITGLEDGLLPHMRHYDKDNNADMEEERRLFYVGLTRAQKKVSLSSAKKRRVFNQWMANPPSRFLAEIPRELLDSGSAPSPARTQKNSLLIGASVFHPTYGKGTIEDVQSDFEPVRATVNFLEFGKRRVTMSQLQLR